MIWITERSQNETNLWGKTMQGNRNICESKWTEWLRERNVIKFFKIFTIHSINKPKGQWDDLSKGENMPLLYQSFKWESNHGHTLPFPKAFEAVMGTVKWRWEATEHILLTNSKLILNIIKWFPRNPDLSMHLLMSYVMFTH